MHIKTLYGSPFYDISPSSIIVHIHYCNQIRTTNGGTGYFIYSMTLYLPLNMFKTNFNYKKKDTMTLQGHAIEERI